MAGGTSTRSLGLRGIVMLGMDADRPGIGKFFVLAVAGKAEVVVVVCFRQLGPAGPSMGVVAVKAVDPGIEMAALLKVEPLLMVGLRVGLGISPDAGFELVIVGQGFS